jgi:hypothetical protein
MQTHSENFPLARYYCSIQIAQQKVDERSIEYKVLADSEKQPYNSDFIHSAQQQNTTVELEELAECVR